MTATQTASKPELNEPFAERVDLLFRELERAIHYDRPSILLAIFSSAYVLGDAQFELIKKLSDLNQAIEFYPPAGEKDADIPLRLLQYPNRERTVFFISGLQWGGGPDGRDAYRALNFRREYFVEHRIRAVFWLTEQEAIDLPNYAPDFWAFRHRVVEFVETPSARQIAEVVSVLAGINFGYRELPGDVDEKIAFREDLLRDLPSDSTTLTARADLLYTLGYLYLVKRKYDRALALTLEALEIAEQLKDIQLQAGCYNNLGIIYRNVRKFRDSLNTLRKAVDLAPNDSAPHANIGLTYHDMGRYNDAISAFQKALNLNSKDNVAQASLGTTYLVLGRYEDARVAYEQAIATDPKWAIPYDGLGNAYAVMNRPDEAVTAYQHAIDVNPNLSNAYVGLGNVYHDQGRNDQALLMHQRAIEIDPDNAAIYFNMGTAYYDLGRFDDALGAYKHSIELGMNMISLPYFYLAKVEAQLGNDEAALNHLKQAATLDNQWRDVYLQNTQVFAKLQNDKRFKTLIRNDKSPSTFWRRLLGKAAKSSRGVG
jgi:tetratricopeptide (TPR) repeat protein